MTSIDTVEALLENNEALQAAKTFLFQLADDDYITSFRGSEWLGLAPHIEEDVAFSSITQNTMGHAVLVYQTLEALGEAEADKLAHARPAGERLSSVYLEKPNGPGTYLDEPHYDWALAVIRLYLYETWKKIRLQTAARGSIRPVAAAAEKILMEQPYHLAHWKMWAVQLLDSTPEAKERLEERIAEAWREAGDMISFGGHGQTFLENGVTADSEEALQLRWLEEVRSVLPAPAELPLKEAGDGRRKEHGSDLDQALKTCSEVFTSDREAVW
ncbi:1,2-phenylacetyl-CoA epoxidase subunit PaaC [Alkalicoccus urumqiensis]|uniref:Phenylacetate-CoA oxygenase subunit PaaI n=1 Tax=Alkalicoccus urumqiensis TaxID=1548213 RepID=A0A2P6ME09_ALKUR|nr:1,2-phenylacetyl-CoA epoxidase subunit PaaC [Alkalicoccus urumqiensis]PRO64518.1 phenylacetate-CoA oxygenase subunit PaaI [Alkalicoccus urumqiensis]